MCLSTVYRGEKTPENIVMANVQSIEVQDGQLLLTDLMERQVVVVFTYSQPEYDSWNIVGLYYDVGLEQYSGIAINSRAGYGYGY